MTTTVRGHGLRLTRLDADGRPVGKSIDILGTVTITFPEHSMNYIARVQRRLAELLPDCDERLIGLYTLLLLTRGTSVNSYDVHDAWAVWRNTTDPEHKSLVPYGQLAPEVQRLDHPYRDAIRRVAEELIQEKKEASS